MGGESFDWLNDDKESKAMRGTWASVVIIPDEYDKREFLFYLFIYSFKSVFRFPMENQST